MTDSIASAKASEVLTGEPLAGANANMTQDLSDLPSPNTQRWDTKRKAQVVDAVRGGRITLEQACEIYAMSVDEFLAWQSLFDRYGAKGLMATRVKEFRERRMYG